jgi:hypothetical protein
MAYVGHAFFALHVQGLIVPGLPGPISLVMALRAEAGCPCQPRPPDRRMWQGAYRRSAAMGAGIATGRVEGV